MNSPVSAPFFSWRRSRYGFATFWFLSLLAGWLVLRVILFAAYRPAGLPIGEVVRAFLAGFHRDVFAGLLGTIPLLGWLLIIRDRTFLDARWHRAFFLFWAVVFAFAQVFLLVAEFFFDEFKSRFNTVAVDYVEYPKEVAVNIWESYHVGLFLAVCFGLALAWVWLANKLFSGMFVRPFRFRKRLLHLLGAMGLVALLASTLNLKGPHVSDDRTLNEIANNGALSFFVAAWTHHLDYGAFYKTMPLDEAYRRARTLVAEPNTQFVEEGQSIRRRVAGDATRPRLNMIIFLEESLGSDFWGCLGRKNTLTPELDKLAAQEGLLFTNIYACGNRTVRGMEGVLSSFPPLPGDSIVKRDRSDDVETIARVLRRDGYTNMFLYGGRGLFDSMRSFTMRNGYDRFVEQKHFANPTFTTIWGVCDEDLYDRTIEECRAVAQTGKPFFATVLTVSNHKPFTYPPGRIKETPNGQQANAVRYTDYALGRFFRQVKQESFWTNTVFVVVADHGARVYGSQSIPIHSYEIPVLILGPAAVNSPSRNGQLGSSLDVSPTLLGLVGRPYESQFFGRDLLKSQPAEGRAFLNHNRDIGMLARNRLVVLNLMQTSEFYQGDPKKGEIKPLAQPTGTDRELEKDTMAIFQVADDLYIHQRYRIDAEIGAPEKAAGK